MHRALRSTLLTLSLGLSGTSPAQTTGVPSGLPLPAPLTLPDGQPVAANAMVDRAEIFDLLVQADFRSCGQTARRDPVLDAVAARVARGFSLKTELQSAKVRAQKANQFVLPKLGRAPAVVQALANQCAMRVGFTRYGLAVQDGRAALVSVKPAQIEADDPRAWLLHFLDLTNEARRQGQRCGDELFHSAPPLTWNDQLAISAQTHLNDMIRLNFRGHMNPETGSAPPDRARAAGYPSTAVGENAAYDSTTPEDALQSLLDSPSHCRILMNSDWRDFGAAMGNGTPNTVFATYWVQDFGR
ncbi:CAP domain-containing protein [Deinococcus taeanensis]|uniref:CAP domain-containing protein n=1 Tax=Deinococcus taeanensis TaxID=2737050 RepID=UPI001CDC2EC0|nr:CAP domain-containing protein [Deinococcus taeanensis]UBV41473.1 CAP domain-containing protein [Deinococcus taeanensis]